MSSILRQLVFVSACLLLFSTAHSHVIMQHSQDSLQESLANTAVRTAEAATVAISKHSALAPNLDPDLPDPDVVIAVPNSPDANNSSSNATHQVITGQLGLYIFENQDGTDTLEFCVLMPDDGSDALVVELENMYADCRDGLSGVFNVTAHSNVVVDKLRKGLCDPTRLSSCVQGGEIEEAEVIGMPAGFEEDDPYTGGFDISQFFDLDSNFDLDNNNNNNLNNNNESSESEFESELKYDTPAANLNVHNTVHDVNEELQLCPYIKQLCLRCASDLTSVFSSTLCADFAAACERCDALDAGEQ